MLPSDFCWCRSRSTDQTGRGNRVHLRQGFDGQSEKQSGSEGRYEAHALGSLPFTFFYPLRALRLCMKHGESEGNNKFSALRFLTFDFWPYRPRAATTSFPFPFLPAAAKSHFFNTLLIIIGAFRKLTYATHHSLH